MYGIAAKVAEAKSGAAVPRQCPYWFEQAINENWLP